MTTATLQHAAPRSSQGLWIGKYLSHSYLWALGWVLVIAIAANLILQAFPSVFTFTFAEDAEVVTTTLGFIIPPVAAVAVTAFVIAIVNAGYSRIMIGQGATRGAIAVGNLLAMGVGLAFIVVAALLWRAVENLVPSIVSIETQLDLTLGWRQYVWIVGIMAAALVFGGFVCTLFQRWHWIVGTALLVTVLVILPWFTLATPLILQIIDWWGTPWISAAILAGIFAWLVRGVEVN